MAGVHHEAAVDSTDTAYDEGPCALSVTFSDVVVHKQVLRLLLVAAKRQLGKADMVGVIH